MSLSSSARTSRSSLAVHGDSSSRTAGAACLAAALDGVAFGEGAPVVAGFVAGFVVLPAFLADAGTSFVGALAAVFAGALAAVFAGALAAVFAGALAAVFAGALAADFAGAFVAALVAAPVLPFSPAPALFCAAALAGAGLLFAGAAFAGAFAADVVFAAVLAAGGVVAFLAEEGLVPDGVALVADGAFFVAFAPWADVAFVAFFAEPAVAACFGVEDPPTARRAVAAAAAPICLAADSAPLTM